MQLDAARNNDDQPAPPIHDPWHVEPSIDGHLVPLTGSIVRPTRYVQPDAPVVDGSPLHFWVGLRYAVGIGVVFYALVFIGVWSLLG